MNARKDAAGAGPPLLLVPGTLCDERMFAPLLARLPDRRTVVIRLSDRDVEIAAQRILDEAPRQFMLLGFSLGGIVAAEIALAAPERVAGLALIGANLEPVAPSLHKERRREALQAAGDTGAHVRDTLWPRYVASGRRDDAALRALLATMAEAGGGDLFASQTDLALSRTERRDRLASLPMPTLVLGGAQDEIAPPASQRDIAARLPAAELAIVDDAGHFAPLERPDEVAVHVAAWLARADDARTRPSPKLIYPAPLEDA